MRRTIEAAEGKRGVGHWHSAVIANINIQRQSRTLAFSGNRKHRHSAAIATWMRPMQSESLCASIVQTAPPSCEHQMAIRLQSHGNQTIISGRSDDNQRAAISEGTRNASLACAAASHT